MERPENVALILLAVFPIIMHRANQQASESVLCNKKITVHNIDQSSPVTVGMRVLLYVHVGAFDLYSCCDTVSHPISGTAGTDTIFVNSCNKTQQEIIRWYHAGLNAFITVQGDVHLQQDHIITIKE